MNLAIIGANGFIGNRLVETLALRRDVPAITPIPIVRQPASLALPARFNLEWRIADALDESALAQALRGCDAVVHAALGDPAQIEKMPATLIAATVRAGISNIVYLSSASVHGQNIAPGTTEEAPLHTRHELDYNNAKVRAERALFRLSARHPGMRVTMLRPSIVFGPRSRWIADTAADLIAGTAWLHNHGAAICNAVYVDNLVHAILLALDKKQKTNGAYFISDAEAVTWRDFYEPIARALEIDPGTILEISELPTFPHTLRQRIEKNTAGPLAQKLLPLVPFRLKQNAKKIIAALSAPPPPESWTLPDKSRPRITQELADLRRNRTRLSFEKAARELGYTPRFTFSEGMEHSLAWLRFARPDYFERQISPATLNE